MSDNVQTPEVYAAMLQRDAAQLDIIQARIRREERLAAFGQVLIGYVLGAVVTILLLWSTGHLR